MIYPQSGVYKTGHNISQRPKASLDKLGQCLDKSGQLANGIGQIGTGARQLIEKQQKNLFEFFVPASFLLKRCFFDRKQRLAPKRDVVRMVCENIRPTRPKQPVKPPLLHFFAAMAPNLGTVRPVAILGPFLLLAALPSGTSATEAWKPMGQSTSWEARPIAFGSASFGKPSISKTAKRHLVIPSKGSKVDRLLAVIAAAEAPHGYDAIHYSASQLPKKTPTAMTLREIERWVKATPGQHHAIGRYQIIPPTFASLKRKLRLSDGTRFDEQTQDLMGRYLLAEAGYSDFTSGKINRDAFMDNLAQIWAGLPLGSGRSAYHKYAGNKATITRKQFRTAMIKIFG